MFIKNKCMIKVKTKNNLQIIKKVLIKKYKNKFKIKIKKI